LLPQPLRAADVTLLAAFVAATQQNHDLSAVQSVINTESRAKTYPQLKHAAAHGFAIAEISGANSGQSGVHRRLHPQVAKGIKPFVKRDKPVLKLQLLDFPFVDLIVIYR
jgi:hypothetical protein